MKELITGILGSLITLFILWAIGELGKVPTILVPAHSVVAFNQKACPEGWSEFSEARGRVIVGSGHGEGLENRRFNSTGGAEHHTLTIDEIPSHRHQLPTYDNNPANGSHEVGNAVTGQDWYPQEFSQTTGGGKAHNNMQPYIALTYCVKNESG